MNATTIAGWPTLAADATTRLDVLAGHVRAWAAARHARGRTSETPGHVVAALDAATRPPRTRLVARDLDATDRDRAEAAADDLWDAVAATWAMVRRLAREDDADVGAVVVELHTAGGWLAAFPVHASRHDRAISDLFNTAAVVRPNMEG